MHDVVVVGAGISGLAVATFLGPAARVLEASPEPGGNVRSDLVDGRVLDRAANGWLNNEPAMDRLLARVGLSERRIPPSDAYGTRWIFADGRMHPVPLGPGALLRSRLLSPAAKLRLLAEPLMPRGTRDQSVGTFVVRRLGPAFVDRMVGPMAAGIYAGDPWELSLAAAFPRMQELEEQYRSLFLAMLRLKRGGAPSGRLETLPGGAGELTATLASALGDRLQCNAPVTGLVRQGDHWALQTPDGTVRAGAVVLACPAPAQAALLRAHDPELAAYLADIPYAPVAVVCTVWDGDAWERPPEGFGVLAARGERLGGVLGALFTSNVFPHQARPGETLIRTIIGGAIAPDAARDSEEGLLQRTLSALQAFLGPTRTSPRLVRIYRHPAGIPQYVVGHPARVARIRERVGRLHGLLLAGNHLQGIGVKDCAREGERIAQQVRAFVGGPSSADDADPIG